MFQLPEAEHCHRSFSTDGYVLVEHSVTSGAAIDLAASATRASHSFARSIERRGRSGRLAYRVVTGDWIASEAPMLYELYTSPILLAWVRDVTNCASVSRSQHVRSAININCLTAPGDEYPLHHDALPYTVLLFLSDVEPAAGGQFLIQSLGGAVARIQPRLGQLLLMDGARCRHGVEALARDAWRLTVPMVFPTQLAERPEGLDLHLYGAEGPST